MKTRTEIKITKGVLFAAALITAVVAVYTTWALFTSPVLNLNFSPEEIYKNLTNVSNDSNNDGVSFVVEQNCSGDTIDNSTNGTCRTSIIPPADPDSSPQPGAIGFLATLEIDGTPNGAGLAIMIVIEIIVIFIVYRELNIFMHDNN